jgi:hypothetical protein
MIGYIEQNAVVWFYQPRECEGCHTMHTLFLRQIPAPGRPGILCVANCVENPVEKAEELLRIARVLDSATHDSAEFTIHQGGA